MDHYYAEGDGKKGETSREGESLYSDRKQVDRGQSIEQKKIENKFAGKSVAGGSRI